MNKSSSEKIGDGATKKKKKTKTTSESNVEDHKDQEVNITWPNNILRNLLNRVTEIIPSNDKLSYKSRIDRLSWDKVSFDGHTEEECKKVFLTLCKHARKFRLLEEVIEDAHNWLAGNKNGTARSKPKRPPNAFMLFLKKNSALRKQYAHLTLGEYTKTLNNMYKELPAEERQKYIDVSRIKFEDYERKKTVYMLKNPTDKTIRLKKVNRNKTAFGEYLDDCLKDSLMENVSEELMLKYSYQWNDLNEDEQLIWFEKANIKNKEFKDRLQLSKDIKKLNAANKAANKKKPSSTEIDGPEKNNVKKRAKKTKDVTASEDIAQPSTVVEEDITKSKPKKKKEAVAIETKPVELNPPEEKAKIKKKKTSVSDDIYTQAEPISAEEEIVKKKKKKRKHDDEMDNPNVSIDETPIKKKKKTTHTESDMDVDLKVDNENVKIKKKKKKSSRDDDEKQVDDIRMDTVEAEEHTKVKKKKKKDREAYENNSQSELESPGKTKKKKKKRHSDD